MTNHMKKKSWAYQSPESEDLAMEVETSFLASILSDKPVDDSEEGETEGWGWN